MEFNKSFDQIYEKKETEMAKIKEKNKRIRKILEDLNLPVDVQDPEMGPLEKPEMLLSVTDTEVNKSATAMATKNR